MTAVTLAEMLAAEARARRAGWSEERLLDLAGSRLGRAIGRFFPHPGTAVAYLGKGHNAGDAIVALAVLRDEFGWKIAARTTLSHSDLAPLTRRKYAQHRIPPPLPDPPAPFDLAQPLLLIDGLAGIGVRGALREPLASLACEINRLRTNHGAAVAAVDLPSGMDADTGEPGPAQVIADVTFMIANPKVGLLQSHAVSVVGALALVPVEILEYAGSGDLALVTPAAHPALLPPRPFEFHKGQAGRVSILAGSPEYTGAAALCASGALRGGAGLVRLFVPKGTEALVASRCPAEIIIQASDSPAEVFSQPADAIVIGCGLGPLDDPAAHDLLHAIPACRVPLVLDADALNLIARRNAKHLIQSNHLITPHPGEFARLSPESTAMSRESAAREFCKNHPCALLFKGSRTLIADSPDFLWCNATGHPGMASGGQGDVLAGVLGALLATGMKPRDAASLGAWSCGRASEIAVWRDGHSAESLTASDTLHRLGQAFADWRSRHR